MKQQHYDVFLSHGSPDGAWVQTLHAELQDLGVSAFLDKADIRPGENFVRVLSDGLDEAALLVLVLSHGTTDRPWVELEWTSWLAKKGPRHGLLPVRLDDIDLPALLAPFQGIPALDRDAKRVAGAIAETVGKNAGATKPFAALPLCFFIQLGTTRDSESLVVRGSDGRDRCVPVPWTEPAFQVAWLEYRNLLAQPLQSDRERADLIRHASILGARFFAILFGDPDEAKRLTAATKPGSPIPPVVLRSDDDIVLSLPWELLFDNERFLVRDGVIDLVRSTAAEVGASALLRTPTEPFSLVTNVSAPEGGGLDYEGESYRITKALTKHCAQTPTELGTLADLVATVRQKKPTGIHFSGHGAPGQIVFEDDLGQSAPVAISNLIAELRTAHPDGLLPKFFYLASCHGNTRPRPDEGKQGAEISAAQLHRAGVTEVVGYYGPIVDELSTRAEEALYVAVADGESTRTAVRQARQAMQRPFGDANPKVRPGESAPTPDPGTKFGDATHVFAWAQLVFYHRGIEVPLGTKVDRGKLRLAEAQLQRSFVGFESRKMLTAGFIGRRGDLHRIRRRLKEGKKVLVLQGLGGLGKTTLAGQVVRMLAEPGAVCTFWCQEAERDADAAEALVGQLIEFCRQRFGPAWEAVVSAVDRKCGADPARRFLVHLQRLVESHQSPLAIYLDNAESLLRGPVDALTDRPPDPAAFGSWRSPALQQIWQILRKAAQQVAQLHVVASCRYHNADFEDVLVSVGQLPPDAMFRLTAWFPALRRLSSAGRLHLVERLQGHPRAVEFADDLIGKQLLEWRKEHGAAWAMPCAADPAIAAEREQIVDPALPKVQERLWDDLLLECLWRKVLDDDQRRMLYRMTVLRRSWDRGLVASLGEPGEPEQATARRFEALAATSLVALEQVLVSNAQGIVRVEDRYSMHRTTRDFVVSEHPRDNALIRATHERIGHAYENWCQGQEVLLEHMLEGGHHLGEAGAFDPACDLLGRASEWLQGRGQVRLGLQVVRPLTRPTACGNMSQERLGKLHGTVGAAHLLLSEVPEAIEHCQKALTICRTCGSRRGEANASLSLGSAHLQIGEMLTAIDYLQRALGIYCSVDDRRGEGSALGSLGIAYLHLGDTSKSIWQHRKALATHRSIGDRRGEGCDIGNLGNALLQGGKAARAVVCHVHALAISRELGDRRGEGSDLGNMGAAYVALGLLPQAISCLRKALAIRRMVGDRHGEGGDLGNLGCAYGRIGDHHRAIQHHDLALAIYRDIDDRHGQGGQLSNLGVACARLGRFAKAREHFHEALRMRCETGDRYGEAVDLRNLGLANADLGELSKAVECLEQSLLIGQRIGDSGIVSAAQGELRRLSGNSGGGSAGVASD